MKIPVWEKSVLQCHVGRDLSVVDHRTGLFCPSQGSLFFPTLTADNVHHKLTGAVLVQGSGVSPLSAVFSSAYQYYEHCIKSHEFEFDH